MSFLFPVSNALVFSPLVCEAFSCCLVFVLAFASLRNNRARFTRKQNMLLMVASAVLGTVAAVLVSVTTMPLALMFVASAIIGIAVAVPFYSWADVLAQHDARVRMGTATAGLVLASLFEYVLGLLSTSITSMDLIVAVLAAASLVCYWRGPNTNDGHADEPLIIRPASTHHFRLVLVAIVLFAFVFGATSGTTAYVVSASVTREFQMQAAVSSFVVSLAFFVLLFVSGKTVELSTLGRALMPILAVLFLLHNVVHGSLGGLLPVITLGFWQVIQVFLMLLLIDIARSGVASLSFVFPTGWSVACFGFALGALFGQCMSALFGVEESAVQSIAAGLTIVAVLASSALGAARYPHAKPAVQAASAQDDPSGDSAIDPIAHACDELVERYELSSREREVFELLARGNTRASIGERLFISENTVRVHVKNIYAKLHIHSKQQLIDIVDEYARNPQPQPRQHVA